VPSQFSHEILNANPYAYLDDAPLEERRARAVEMRRILPESVLEEVGKLDPAAIEQVRDEAWPDVRDADELHDVLHTLIALPISEFESAVVDRSKTETSIGPWSPYFERLVAEGRAEVATFGQRRYWIAVERARLFTSLFPEAVFDRPVADMKDAVSSYDDAMLALVTGWMAHIGPTTAEKTRCDARSPGRRNR
jgi:ATP-dependent Lhr-like helicase